MLPYKTAQIFLLIVINLLSASCARNSSLTFVIDDTGSMWNDINEVRLAAKGIMNTIVNEKASEIKDIVLVTFNDPGITSNPAAVVRKKTISYNELKRALDDIEVHTDMSNRDCEEYSLTGIELALKESRPNSYLFVFTDAPAKDFEKLNEIIRLCEKKQSQVTFVLTGNCGKAHEKSFLVYHEIAKVSAGQVFTVPKEDIRDVIKTIEETVKGKKAVVLWKVMAPSFILKPVPFKVDDKTDYVIVSTSGLDVELKVTKEMNKRARQVPHETLLWNRRGKVVKIKAHQGTYYAWARGDTDVTIVIYARTDFTFEHGFSEFVPKSMDDVSKLPIAGRQHYLSISVTDPEHTVYVHTALLLDMRDRILNKLPLRKANGNFYITGAFISPSTMFKIKVIGTIIKTGQDIERSSKTAFEPTSPPEPKHKIPEVTISEGKKMEVDFGADLTLTCMASAYPVPSFAWTSDDGKVFNTKSYTKEEPYDHISYLKLSNVQRSDTYRCNVGNNEGLGNSAIEIIARSPFKITPSAMSQSETTKVKYGVKTKLRCDVKSAFPIEIKWKTPLKPTDYDLVDGDREIIIKSVNMRSQGKYTCDAVLKSGAQYPGIKHTITTNIIISNLESPSFSSSTTKTITAKSGESVKITCKISGGIPAANVSWKIKRNGDDEFRHISASGQELLIKNMILADSGLYKCIAENPIGSISKETEIIVNQAPATIIEERAIKTVPYGSNEEFKCKIIANPQPIVVWKDNYGKELLSTNILLSNDTIISKVKINNIKVNNTYSCHARNSLGQSVNRINVAVLSPFVVYKHPTENIDVHYGASLNIVCDIKSSLPIRIKWLHQKTDNLSDVTTPNKNMISSDGLTLTIASIDLGLAGKYTCEASLESNKNKTISYTTNVRIDDLNAPNITNVHTDIYKGVTGDNVLQIPCDVIGFPEPTITWKSQGKVVTSDDKITVSKNELRINNPKEQDSNSFTCEAVNKFGSTSRRFTAVISDFIDVEEILDNHNTIHLVRGESKDIQCQLPHTDPQSVRWFLRGETTGVHGLSYPIKNATLTDDGNYTCRVNTEQGSFSQNYIVDVGFQPIILMNNYQSHIIYWNGGKGDTLYCSVSAKPIAETEWFYNGKPLSKSSDVLITGWGNYSCKATNVHGSVSRTMEVNNMGCVINRAADSIQKTPLLIDDTESWPYIRSENEFLLMDRSQAITLVCATEDQATNTLKTHPTEVKVDAECVKEDQFLVQGKEYHFLDLQCKDIVKPSFVETQQPCMTSGKVIKVGFKLDSFLEVYEICYDEVKQRTFYTKVEFSDSNSDNYVGTNFDQNVGIKTQRRKEILQCQYNSRRSVRSVDVAFGPAQIATLSDKYNSIKVYEPCQNSTRISWGEVEDIVQKATIIVNSFTVWTGASHYDGKTPRFLWKVLKFMNDDWFETVVYVNSPDPVPSDILCTPTVPDVLNSIDSRRDEFTYLCSFEEFLTAFNYTISDFVEVSGSMSGDLA